MLRRTLCLIGLLALVHHPASACIAYFGYTGSEVDTIDAITSAVPVSAAYVVVDDPQEYIVDDVAYLNSKAGPVFINLRTIIFNPNTVTKNCTHYERGGPSASVAYTNLRGDFADRLDTFFAVNAALFTGSIKVIGVIVHDEANNACVETWKLNTAADYVRVKLSQPGNYLPRLVAGYGLRNTPGGAVSNGFPVDANGKIVEFPFRLTMIGYWVYDIFDPNNPSNPNNINAESWTSLNTKLDKALRPGQTTVGVVKAFCWPGGDEEGAWGIGCPNMAVWKLGVVATNWRNYWLNDPRNEAMLAFHWPSVPEFFGTANLPLIWGHHSTIDPARNCTMSFPTFP